MISEDEFDALVTLLVDCGVIPAAVMSKALQKLSERLAAKARGEMQTEWSLHPEELYNRARTLREAAVAFSDRGLADAPAPAARTRA